MSDYSPLKSIWDYLTGQEDKPEPKQASPEIFKYVSTDFGEDTSGTTPQEFDFDYLKSIPKDVWDNMHWMDKAALATSMTPVVNATPIAWGTGIAADVRSAIQEPEEFFTPANLSLTGFSYFPFARAAKYGEQLGIFAGTKAKGADLAALERAKEMQAAGASREQIWRDTGWFESADGNWKWEIDDSQASLADPDLLFTSGEVRDVLKHPGLEGQYNKDVMGTDIIVTQPLAGATSAEGGYTRSWKTDGGMVNPEQITTKPTGVAPHLRIPSILHELQHNVQRREGFARGGSPENYLEDARAAKTKAEDIVKAANERMKKAMDGKAALSKSDPQYQAKYDAYDAEYQKAIADKMQVADVYQRSEMEIAHQMYKDLAGEEEARAAANRWNLTADERRERFPEKDMDIPLVRQAVEMQPTDEFGDIQKSVDYRGFDDYLAKVNPKGKEIPADARPNLGMGDMYGMLPKGSKAIKSKDGITFYKGTDDNYYATAYNPDVGEQDVVGYISGRGDMTELAVVEEMQGKGIGSELQYLFRKENPYAPTGGLTESGKKLLEKTFKRLEAEGVLPK